MKKLFIVVNVDWFFLSHRLPIALSAVNEGYDVTIIACDTGKGEEIRKHGLDFIHVPFERSGTNIFRELRCLNILRSIYKTHAPDIVHHVTIKVALYGSIAARLASVKAVVNAISGLGYNFTSNRNGLMQKFLFELMKFGFKRNTTRFIFQNQDDIKVFEQFKIVNSDQISLIKGSGVDLKKFHQVPPPSNNITTVLLCARMLYDKGIIEYIEAARALEDKFKGSVQFLLAGDIDKENLSSIAEHELKLKVDGNYINWIGHQSDVFNLLAGSDIVVLPSYREGLPKSLIEAAAVGRPIITTDVPGCKECVIDGYNGFLVPAEDSHELAIAIERLLDNRDLREEMGRHSRILAEREFSIESVIKETLNIYTKSLA